MKPVTWQEVPFIRLLLPFVLGIGVSMNLPRLPEWTIAFWGGALLLSLGVALTSSIYARRWLSGFSFFITLFLTGWLLAHFHDESTHSDHFRNSISGTIAAKGSIWRVQPWKNGKKLWVEVYELKGKESVLQVKGNILVYATGVKEAYYGNTITFIGKYQNIPGPKNPEAFDYQRFLKWRNVHDQVFLKPEQFKITNEKSGNLIARWCDRSARFWKNIIDSCIQDPGARATAQAMVLGLRDEIPEEVDKSYRNTGATHVLAVSGMHIGYLYAALATILQWLQWKRKHLWLKSAILIVAIWLFALITGGSASVLRAAAMFTLLHLGQQGKRFAHPYNLLPASALVLLVYDPFLLADAGFQLSYAAVAGLILVYPVLEKIYWTSDYWKRWLWQLTAATLAAQFATLPLCMYWFHKFPLTFLISGIPASLVSILILFGGVGLLLFHPWPVLIDGLGIAMEKVILWNNQWISYLANWQGGLIKGFWLDGWELLLWYCCLAFLMLTLVFHLPRYLLLLLTGVALLSGSTAFGDWQQFHQKVLTVYSIKGNWRIEWIEGKNAIAMDHHPLMSNEQEQCIWPHHWARGIQEEHLIPSAKKRFTVDSCVFDWYQEHKLNESDYCLVTSPALPNWEIPPGPATYLLLGDLSKESKKQWQKYLRKYNAAFVDIQSSGALQWIQK